MIRFILVSRLKGLEDRNKLLGDLKKFKPAQVFTHFFQMNSSVMVNALQINSREWVASPNHQICPRHR